MMTQCVDSHGVMMIQNCQTIDYGEDDETQTASAVEQCIIPRHITNTWAKSQNATNASTLG